MALSTQNIVLHIKTKKKKKERKEIFIIQYSDNDFVSVAVVFNDQMPSHKLNLILHNHWVNMVLW